MIEETHPYIPGLGEGPPDEPAPGAAVWVDKYEYMAPPGQQGRLLAGQFSQLWTGTMPTGRIRFQVLEQVAPTPPPLAELVQFTGPVRAKPGETITLAATLSVNVLTQTVVTVQTFAFGDTAIIVPAGKGMGAIQLTVPVGQAEGVVVFTATLRDKTMPWQVTIYKDPVPIPPDPIPVPPIPTPGPVPPVLRTIDMTGKTQAQIQAAIHTAQPGDGLFFGPGVFTFPAAMGGDGEGLSFVNKEGVTLFGAGPSTVFDFLGREGIWCRQGGRVGQVGNCIRNLCIKNARRAVCALDPQRLLISAVQMLNSSHGYASERTTAFDNGMFEWPVTLIGCIIRDWGAQGVMLHGGETMENCQLIDTPGNSGSTYSHGLYIQGAKNVRLTDITIENTSGHSLQVYSDSATHAANGAMDILMERVTCRRCFMGPVIAANGHYDRITINDLSCLETISRNAATFVISATNDFIDNLVMNNLLLDGGGDAMALQSGQTGGIRGMRINGMTVKNHSVGIRIGSAATGWPYTRIEGSVVTGYQTPGVPLPVVGTSPGLVIS